MSFANAFSRPSALSSAPILFIHAGNDYDTAPGVALAAQLERLRIPHQLEICPPFGKTPEDGA
jgi:hypothetical protein